MTSSVALIKKLFKAVLSAQSLVRKNQLDGDPTGYLATQGFDKTSLINLADEIGTTLKVTPENSDLVEWFADFLKSYFHESVKSIRIYLEILKVVGHKSTVYRTLIGIYFYDVDTVSQFDFLGNAIRQSNIRTPDTDVFYCMSYIYMGRLYQRLGLFDEARQALAQTLKLQHKAQHVTDVVHYENLQLDFLAQVAKINPFDHDAMSGKPRLIIGAVFFGMPYEELFRTVAARTFFCENNLQGILQSWNPCLVIFCPLFERMRFENSRLYREIEKKMPIKIIGVPEALITSYPHSPDFPSSVMNYSLSGLLQTCLVASAKNANASLINIPPDAIFSDKTAAVITAACEKGHKVVFTPGIRLQREDVKQVLSIEGKNSPPTLALTAQYLTQLALAHLHPATKALLGNNEKLTHPGMIWWSVGTKGLFGNCFQMHPLFVSHDLIQHTPIRRFDSIDGDFVYGLLPNRMYWHQIYVITEPDDLVMFELSGPGISVDVRFPTADIVRSAGSWLATVMRPLNFWLFEKRITFGNIADAEGNALSQEANKIVANLVEWGKGLPFNPKPFSLSFLNKMKASFHIFIENYEKLGSPSSADTIIPRRMEEAAESFRVLYTIAVWGERYIHNFLNICLPSLLAEGNLGNMPNNQYSLFLIHSRKQDVPLFEANVQYQRLKHLMLVEFVFIEPEEAESKYLVLNKTQSDSVRRSENYDALCFLYSDFLWAKGSLRFALRKLGEGYEGVISPVPPLVLEDFYSTLHRHMTDFLRPSAEEEGAFDISVSARTLIKHAKPILHPMMRDNIIDYKVNTYNPAYVLWLGPGDDLLVRCFHSHPVMLKVKRESPEFWTPFYNTLDEWYLPTAFPVADRLYFVKDSDEMAAVSLTERNLPVCYAGEHYHLNAALISAWAESFAAPMHKLAFDYYTLWHEHDIDEAMWQPIIEKSKSTAREVRFRLSMPDSIQKVEYPLQYSARKNRLRRQFSFNLLRAIAIKQPSPTATATVPVLKRWIFKAFRRIALKIPSETKRHLLLFVPTKKLRNWILTFYYESRAHL